MGRTVVRRVNQPRGRKMTDMLILAGAAAIVLFALIGVVSAGAYVAGKVSGTSTPHKTQTASYNPSKSTVAQARLQATAIVHNAQVAGKQIVTAANQQAHKQAATIVGNAKRQAQTVPHPAAAAPPTAAPAVAAPPAVAPTAVPYVAPGGTGGQTGSTIAGGAGSSTGAGTSQSSVPDLSSVPSTWLVVGYGATFGAGPGSAGSISVINRSSKAFSGTAEVRYANGSVASAPFSNLAPGQSEVLPLNGPAFPGGYYRIVMVGVH